MHAAQRTPLAVALAVTASLGACSGPGSTSTGVDAGGGSDADILDVDGGSASSSGGSGSSGGSSGSGSGGVAGNDSGTPDGSWGAEGGVDGGGMGGTFGALFFDDFVQSAPPVGPVGNATTWLSRFPFGGVEYLNGDGNVAYMCDPSTVGSNPGAIGYNPFGIGGGVLTIQAQSVASSGISNPAATAWNSGTITSCNEVNGEPTPGLFASAHGYFEVRAKWPKGGVQGTPGWWPGVVLYALPYNGQNSPGEIDFPECLGGDTSRSEWTVHPGPGTNYYGPGPIDLGDGRWHTVGADVQPSAIDFYLDGTKIFSNPPGSTWNPNQQWYFNLPMEVSVVGSWGGGLPNVAAPGGPDPSSWKLDYAGCWQDFATRQAQGPARAPSSP
jgi:hypothetical protein